jgi:ATPase subunit of ABC transporter with duplicated ATPase domains
MVGANGFGKTTVLRLIRGGAARHGPGHPPKGLRIGYLPGATRPTAPFWNDAPGLEDLLKVQRRLQSLASGWNGRPTGQGTNP